MGASGFVGSTIAEELLEDGIPVRCLIHSTGNAWRLARRPIELELVDLLEPDSIRRALADCSHVINCARGKSEAMSTGVSNLLEVCQKLKPDRFVHISSVAVYGNEFGGEVISEDHPTDPSKGSYGWKKLIQDEMVQRAARKGLRAVTVCPPNISGPYSMFWHELCKSLQSNSFAYVDDGILPCPLVDVGNLAHGIRMAMDSDVVDGRRLFVCDQPTVTWQQVISSLASILGVNSKIRSLTSSEAQSMVESKEPSKGSVRKTLGHLVSSGVRRSLRQDPFIAEAEKFAVKWAKRMPDPLQQRFRDDERISVPKNALDERISVRLLDQQLRNVIYSCSAAREHISFQPKYDFQASIDRYEKFARIHMGIGTSAHGLLAHLA